MSENLIPIKIQRLAKHLLAGGAESDAPRVLKIKEAETVASYLQAAKDLNSSEGGPKSAKAPQKKAAKKATKSKAPEPEPEAEVEEEDLSDEFDDDDDDDEDWDAEPELDSVVEEAVEAAEAEESEAPQPPDVVEQTEAPQLDLSSLKYQYLDEHNLLQDLAFKKVKGDRVILTSKLDTEVAVRIGGKTVNVMKNDVLDCKVAAYTLADGSVYPTEFLKAAVQLALM